MAQPFVRVSAMDRVDARSTRIGKDDLQATGRLAESGQRLQNFPLVSCRLSSQNAAESSNTPAASRIG